MWVEQKGISRNGGNKRTSVVGENFQAGEYSLKLITGVERKMI